ncbi:MAG TPA: hypothetical protein VF039_07605 [Longimicrobiales bacterium]
MPTMNPLTRANACLVAVAALTAALPSGIAAQAAALPDPACSQVRAAPLTSGSLVLDLARLDRLGDLSRAQPAHVTRRSRDMLERDCAAGAPLEIAASGVTLRVLPAAVGTWLNTGYAEDRNNGIVWAGRGLSASLAFGAVASWGALSAGFIPEAAWQQNREFELVPRTAPGFSPYVHAHYYEIDLPQRFGPESYGTFDPWGQSFVRVDAHGLAAGWSHEAFRVGPALRNPLLMSGSAGGFHHYFLGTSRPLDLWIATLDIELIAGHTDESEYFDERPGNDRTEFAMWALALDPRWVDGLSLGVASAFQYRPDAGRRSDYLRGFFIPRQENLDGNQLLSLYARWIFPQSGAEIWAEWGRDDRFAGVYDDLLPESDHSQAYTVGFQKVTAIDDDADVRVQAELTALQEKGELRSGRPFAIWYTHSTIRQGYTHEGQILGAGIGPGADAQFIAVDYLRDTWFAGAFVERVRRNDGSAAALEDRKWYPYEHDVALTGGVRGLAHVGPFSLGGTLSLSRRLDRDFLADATNLQLVTEVTWWPGRATGEE